MRFNEIFFLFPDLLHRAFTVFYYKSHRRSGRNFSGRVSNILKKLSLISKFWKYFTETWNFDETWSRTWWNSSAIYLYNLYCKTQKIYGTRCRNLIFYIKRFTKKANVNTYIFLQTQGKSIWRKAWQNTRIFYGCLTSGMLFVALLCEMIKCLVAEPRPHYLDTCQPISLNCSTPGQ